MTHGDTDATTSAEQLLLTRMERDGRIAVIQFNRPRSLNALNGALLDQLEARLDELAELPELHAVVLTGSETCFSVGGDLKQAPENRAARIAQVHRLVRRLADFPALTIAAIEGWALGGGLELAMACTFRAAAPVAKLGLPEVKLGVIPAYGGTQLAPRLIGECRALELLCFGEPVDAAKAERIGLVNWLAEEAGGALALALERAGVLAERSRPALQAARAAVREGQYLPLGEALSAEAAVSGRMLGGEAPPDVAGAFQNRNAPQA